jgi:hypothetical protein
MADAETTVAQAETKADAKVAADQAVASEPHAVHGVRTMLKSPAIVGSTLAGAGIGAALGGPPGAAVGAVAGFLIERHRIFFGPVGRIYHAIRSRV